MNMNDDQPQMHNIPAEMSFLGALMLDPDRIIDAQDLVKVDDLYRDQNRQIYGAMIALFERGDDIDMLTISAHIDTMADQSVEPSCLSQLVNETPSGLHLLSYAKIVSELAFRRRLLMAAQKIADAAYAGEGDEADMLSDAYALLGSTAGEQRSSFERVSDTLQDTVNAIHDRSQGIGTQIVPTGFKWLDKLLGGMQAGDVLTVAGRPGMGKSAFALSIMLNAAKAGFKTGIISLEMSKQQLTQRMISMEGRIDSTRLRTGELTEADWDVITDAANDLAKLDVYIEDSTSLQKMSALRVKATREVKRLGLDLLVIDYMQLMSAGGTTENRQQEVSAISRGIKLLAGELQIPIIDLSQLNRKVEERADKRPVLSDLRESGAIEQDSDVVLFIYREEYYIEDSDQIGLAEVGIAKSRHGRTGVVKIGFDGPTTTFSDVEIVRTELNEETPAAQGDPMDDVKHRMSDSGMSELANHPVYAGLGE